MRGEGIRAGTITLQALDVAELHVHQGAQLLKAQSELDLGRATGVDTLTEEKAERPSSFRKWPSRQSTLFGNNLTTPSKSRQSIPRGEQCARSPDAYDYQVGPNNSGALRFHPPAQSG